MSWRLWEVTEPRKLASHVTAPRGSSGGGDKSQCVSKADAVLLQLSAGLSLPVQSCAALGSPLCGPLIR